MNIDEKLTEDERVLLRAEGGVMALDLLYTLAQTLNISIMPVSVIQSLRDETRTGVISFRKEMGLPVS